MAKNGKHGAQGSGTIRQRSDGRWEARYTVGRDPGTGKQIQRSVYVATQKEVRQKLAHTVAAIDAGTYTEPQRMTVGQWLDIWERDYLGSLKPCTVRSYKTAIKNHIKPALGAVKLNRIHPHTIQGFINELEMAPSSVWLVYRVLHNALEKAVRLDYIQKNPSNYCELPRSDQREIHPLNDQQIKALLATAKSSPLEHMITVALFTGMRQSEILGLTWDTVDFEASTINVNKQLTRPEHRNESGIFISPKSGKSRIVTAAPLVMRALQAQRSRQAELQLKAGHIWDNPHNLAFTNAVGGPLNQRSIDYSFKQIVSAAGMKGIRFHDTRHTYAVNAIRAGDSIKAVQENLGHSTAAFTLDRYGHFTEQMRKDSADRMEIFAKAVLNL